MNASYNPRVRSLCRHARSVLRLSGSNALCRHHAGRFRRRGHPDRTPRRGRHAPYAGAFRRGQRQKVSTAWAQNARNKLAMALELNLKFDEVKEIFYGLIKEADIFMENMVWLEKLASMTRSC